MKTIAFLATLVGMAACSPNPPARSYQELIDLIVPPVGISQQEIESAFGSATITNRNGKSMGPDMVYSYPSGLGFYLEVIYRDGRVAKAGVDQNLAGWNGWNEETFFMKGQEERHRILSQFYLRKGPLPWN